MTITSETSTPRLPAPEDYLQQMPCLRQLHLCGEYDLQEPLRFLEALASLPLRSLFLLLPALPMSTEPAQSKALAQEQARALGRLPLVDLCLRPGHQDWERLLAPLAAQGGQDPQGQQAEQGEQSEQGEQRDEQGDPTVLSQRLERLKVSLESGTLNTALPSLRCLSAQLLGWQERLDESSLAQLEAPELTGLQLRRRGSAHLLGLSAWLARYPRLRWLDLDLSEESWPGLEELASGRAQHQLEALVLRWTGAHLSLGLDQCRWLGEKLAQGFDDLRRLAIIVERDRWLESGRLEALLRPIWTSAQAGKLQELHVLDHRDDDLPRITEGLPAGLRALWGSQREHLSPQITAWFGHLAQREFLPGAHFWRRGSPDHWWAGGSDRFAMATSMMSKYL